MRIPTRSVALAACCTVGLSLLPQPAKAQETTNEEASISAEPLVQVQLFTGARSKKLRGRLRAALKEARVALSKETPEQEGEDEVPPEEIVNAARDQSVRAFVRGHIHMSKKGWDLELTVINGEDGRAFEPLHLRALWLPALLKKIDEQAASLLETQLAQTKLPPPISEPAARVSPAPPAIDASPPLVALRLTARAGIVFLDFSYVDPIADSFLQALVPHSAGPLAVDVRAEWYPGAHFSGGATANVGLVASFTHSLGGTTAIPGGELDTVFQELNLGLRARFPLGSGELGIDLGWGRQSLVLNGDNEQIVLSDGTPGAARGLLPDAQYEYIRAGIDGWLSIGKLVLRPGLFVRVVVDTLDDPGHLAEQRWFPSLSGSAIEATLGLDFPLGNYLAIVADGRLVQYGLDTNFNGSLTSDLRSSPSVPLQSSVAGGVSDLYLGAFLGIRVSFDGTDDTTGSEDFAE